MATLRKSRMAGGDVMAEEPKIDFKVLDAAVKKVLAFKPKKKSSSPPKEDK